jgi:hypothetical protein
MKALATAAYLVILLTACGSASGGKNSSFAAAHSGEQSAGSDPSGRFEVGVNVTTINNWDENRPFLNLIYGATWQMQGRDRGYEDVPVSSLDSNGWIKSVPPGYRVIRNLSIPVWGGNFVCRYDGHGPLNVTGSAVSNVATAAGATRFTLAATYPNPRPALLTYKVEPGNYIRNIDCRETAASVTDTLAPEFTSQLAGFEVIRFMKWQPATEGNWAVAWSTRNKPGDGDYLKNDGVPIEIMVQTANQFDADAWVTVPWNADDNYVARFATYVRDNLAPGRRVYVEVSNEVWNVGYPVATQACNEAKAERLPGVNGGVGCSGERYAEKTKQVMHIWSNVFAGQMNRLVRVAAFQHVATYWSNALLQYQNLYQSVDAVATAPYFGDELKDSMTLNQIMTAVPDKMNDTLSLAAQQKAIAEKYGLRYITYEAGQSIVFPKKVGLSLQVQRDPRMYDIYKRFLSVWQHQIGDTLNLFALNGGAWGLSEYSGQPLAETPKMRAVKDFLAANKPRSGMPVVADSSTKLCLNQSVIPHGRSCRR